MQLNAYNYNLVKYSRKISQSYKIFFKYRFLDGEYKIFRNNGEYFMPSLD